MTYYKKCLGGTLTFQTLSESPLSARMPRKMKNCILHATLTNDGMVLMGSDMVGEEGLIKGNSVALMLNCSSEEEIKSYYEKLSKEGSADHPLRENFWGVKFGDLTDKFGNRWLLSFDKNKSR